MRGLVFVETLQLSGPQWAALLIAMALYLSSVDRWSAALMSQSVVTAAFWGRMLSIDTRLLFQAARYLREFTWQEFLSEFAHRNYVALQPPFYTFFVSRIPSVHYHQALGLLWALLCAGLMFRLYGENARLALASPIWLLMSAQPSNDMLLFGALLIALRCVQLGHRAAGAMVFGLTYAVKPLAVLLLPFLLLELRGWGLLSLTMWAGYVHWSLHYYFGVKQWDFLLHQLLLR